MPAAASIWRPPTFSAAGSVAAVVGDRGFRAAAGLGGFASGWFDLGLI